MQMHAASRTLSSRWLGRVFNIERCSPAAVPPAFLCPALRRSQFDALRQRPRQAGPSLHTRRLHVQATTTENPHLNTGPSKTLPLQCSGCGAMSQTTLSGQPGYFDLSRRLVKEYLGLIEQKEVRPRRDDEVVQEALRNINLEDLANQGVHLETLIPNLEQLKAAALDSNPSSTRTPLCDRCHGLVHHNTGTSIFHPSVESIRETISESPYKYNHVYHVLDAADFPMSLLPKISQLLDMMPLRSHNRRSRNAKFYSNRKTEMSFIITRSDLLGAKKEDVDHLMPYLREVLREALGRVGPDVRLGNVKCVSSKRNWWTKGLKENIFHRGGGGWMVGKANVGKSQLFGAVFPKGKMDETPLKHKIVIPLFPEPSGKFTDADRDWHKMPDPEYSLLPPAQTEVEYPEMPLVSSLPGTTASPIRLSFGKGKGELIDLPGLPRSDLELHVQEEYRSSLIMRSRIIPEQHVLHTHKSLLLGGFIRLTPQTPGVDFLTYNFTPLKEHATATWKAECIQERKAPPPDRSDRESINVQNISVPEASEKMKLAGSFPLRYDVTRQRAGPLTRKNAANLPVEKLPFRVFSIDILIEGCGWVEVVAQMRAKQLVATPKKRQIQDRQTPEPGSSDSLEALHLSEPVQIAAHVQRKSPDQKRVDPNRLEALDLFPEFAQQKKNKPQNPDRLESLDLSDPFETAFNKPRVNSKAKQPVQEDEVEEELNWPVIDVYTPEGRFVAARRPMNAWLINKTKETTRARPRKSMRFAKKQEKVARRGVA
ncbi:hypothetical protein B0H67DRAFT_592960 [Lasiosphaeris hirsuta]|uniref:Genetic interactor of prohibitins 3, mitochondrial n=1 Tax=Lasiosphaeris hirsuta TaxID=260670 RepID=A0AA39ZWM9_9PEZI|nr:hypothetical protein B0H67DRAFT_592960 [Lasiosphaeris hirsuta]